MEQTAQAIVWTRAPKSWLHAIAAPGLGMARHSSGRMSEIMKNNVQDESITTRDAEGNAVQSLIVCSGTVLMLKPVGHSQVISRKLSGLKHLYRTGRKALPL
jgi:hypothetical protein